MKVFKFKKFLEEAEINLDTLGKSSRGDVLVNKLKKHSEITLNNNQKIKVDKMKSGTNWIEPEIAVDNITDASGNYSPDKAKSYFTKPRGSNHIYIPVFIDEDGDEFKLNQLKKTDEFGSKGAGVYTRSFESLQCLFLGIKQANPGVILKSDNLKSSFENFIKEGNTVFTPESVKVDNQLIERFLNDKDWVSTFCKISNRLWMPKYINLKEVNYIFHASYLGEQSPYRHIEKKYKEFSKNENFRDINISKYCPADAYICVASQLNNVNKQIDDSLDLNGLTITLNNLFDEKLLRPISLKKIKDRFKIITNSEAEKHLPEFVITSSILGDDFKGMGSKISTTSIWTDSFGKNVDLTDRVINFDSSDTGSNVNVDGEVEGSSSRHGKISFPAIKRMIEKYSSGIPGIQNLQTHAELKLKTVDELKEMVMDLVKSAKSLQLELGNSVVKCQTISRGRDISNSENRLISRIQSMQIVLAILQIHNKSPKKSRILITSIMRYALSIETDKFKTPRYLRII